MLRLIFHAIVILVLTLLTQIGGVAWLIACCVRRRLIAFLIAYAAVSVATAWTAPFFGRVALSCFEKGPLEVQSWLYCGLNRTYVTPELADVLRQTAKAIDARYPGTKTLVLDASFPFLDGFPLLPHLSHDDGEKADLAFFYRDQSGYLPGATRSPIGYFAFQQGPTDCPATWPSLRWNFVWLQPWFPAYDLDVARTRAVLETLARDNRVGKILIEPHVSRKLGLSHPKVRFQGCRAARHDDHVHFQLK